MAWWRYEKHQTAESGSVCALWHPSDVLLQVWNTGLNIWSNWSHRLYFKGFRVYYHTVSFDESNNLMYKSSKAHCSTPVADDSTTVLRHQALCLVFFWIHFKVLLPKMGSLLILRVCGNSPVEKKKTVYYVSKRDSHKPQVWLSKYSFTLMHINTDMLQLWLMSQLLDTDKVAESEVTYHFYFFFSFISVSHLLLTVQMQTYDKCLLVKMWKFFFL